MAEALKEKYYNAATLHALAQRLRKACPAFPAEEFTAGVMDSTWPTLGLKARIRQITLQLGRYLPADYPQALGIIDKVVAAYSTGALEEAPLYFPDFVEVYGQDERHWDLSVAALERYTVLASAEFAVRPFILNQTRRMMRQMAAWARHDSEHVRRLASEGCRPLLPWGQALRCFQKDPSPVLAVLELLKADPSPYVRKSVANNLNDLSKTHPDLIVALAKDWHGHHPHTDWIVKHGCRTLLKRGNREVLGLFGYADAENVHVSGFSLEQTKIAPGGELRFSFRIEARQTTGVRLEYGVDYVKANGKRSRKIFQISESSLKKNAARLYTKTHSLADASTRKHYPGTHSVTLIVNGTERGTLDFELLGTA